MKRTVIVVLCLLTFAALACAQPDSTHDISGIWKGSITNQGSAIELIWRIQQLGPDSLIAIHDSPMWGVKDVPVDEIWLYNNRLFMDVHRFPSTYFGELTVDPDSVHGQYKGEGSFFVFNLMRIAQDPHALLPYMAPRIGEDGQREYDWTYSVPAARDFDWPIGHAADVGLDITLLREFMSNVLLERYPNLHSALIVKDGRLVLEEYFYGHSRDEPHPIMSNSKGVIATTLGIAIDAGIVPSIETPIVDLFPEVESMFAEPGKRDITIEHLLTMTAGYDWDEQSTSYYDPRNSNRQMQNSDDFVAHVFTRPLAHEPGTHYTYNSGLPVVIGDIIRRTTHDHWHQYAWKHLFQPLGFYNEFRQYNSDGTGGGVMLRPRDFIKLPWLYLHRGEWNGEQIVPGGWFDNSYKPKWDASKPPYWNHWGGSVMFVAGVPVMKYSGGGFGGQAMFGFPDLNLAVVFTAGNYAELGVEYEEVLSRYILTPLLTADADYTPPDNTSNSGYVALNGTTYQQSAMTGLAALRSAINHVADDDISEAWLYGIAGTAFALNANERVWPNCLGRWSNPRLDDHLALLGYEYDTYAAYYLQSDFADIREQAWQAVRASIDNGIPAIAFDMHIPESYLVYGYDDFGYYYQGMDCPDGYGPTPWNTVGDDDPGWFEVHTITPVDPAPVEDQVIAALEYAVEMYRSPDNFPHQGFVFGPQAYKRWDQALSGIDADWYGIAYNAQAWATCRRNAADFLQEARPQLPESCHETLLAAEASYRVIAESWEVVSRLFPFESTERWEKLNNWQNEQNRLQARSLLRSAATAELQAVEMLESALEALR